MHVNLYPNEVAFSGSLKGQRVTVKDILERTVLAILFVGAGMLIYFVFNPLRPEFAPKADYLGRAALITALVAVMHLLGRSKLYGRYKLVITGLVIMAAAVTIDRVFSIYLMDYLGVDGDTPMDWAIQKLNASLIAIGVVILLTRFTGGSLGSIYIQKGNLKLGLAIGTILFCLAAAGSPLMATFLFKAEGLAPYQAIEWLPWLLVFVLANAAQEEILFRGLFLRKLQPFFGRFLSNFLTVFVFTALHQGVNYTSDETIFLAAVVLLALAWGYLMQKTDSVWGSILFHAGMDIPIMLGIFSGI